MKKPLVIALAALKGGVGKSTLSVHLAAHFHELGKNTLVVDADPQGTSRSWAALSAISDVPRPPVIGMGAEMKRDLHDVAHGRDVVVIDTPPRLGAEQRAALFVADLALVPVTPGPADVWALQETLSLIDDAMIMRPDLKAAIVLNRYAARTALSSSIRSAVENSGIPVLSSSLGSRVAFGEAQGIGQGVTSYAPNSAAANEIKALTQEIMKILEATA